MYIPGDPWCVCDICGLQIRKSKTRKNWKGQIVCGATCYEPRHPQDFVKAHKDVIAVKDARPEPDPIYLEYGDVTADDL